MAAILKTLDDYLSVLKSIQKAGLSPVVVGELSVAFWQRNFSPGIPKEAIFSKDLDLLVRSRDEAKHIEQATGLPFLWSKGGTASPCLAVCRDLEHPTDLLWTIWGIQAEEVHSSAIQANYKGITIRVISPAKLLESKLANCQLDQTDRTDLAQLRAVCELYPRFVKQTFESIRQESVVERDQIKVLKRLAGFLESPSRSAYLKTLHSIGIRTAMLFDAENLRTANTPKFNQFVERSFLPELKKADEESP
jgi:hypothetical protein